LSHIFSSSPFRFPTLFPYLLFSSILLFPYIHLNHKPQTVQIPHLLVYPLYHRPSSLFSWLFFYIFTFRIHFYHYKTLYYTF
jgi:hypothetical protein